MNILIDKLPTKFEIEEYSYKFNSDFRKAIKFELLVRDSDMTTDEGILDVYTEAIKIFFPEIVKDKHLLKAIEFISYFYRGGDKLKNKAELKAEKKSTNKRIYDFEYDADYIYSAFLTQYGIDLNSIRYLHWWKFLAMFRGLDSSNRIVEIMGYRSMDISSIEDKKQKKHYQDLKKRYEIPITKSEDEKIEELNNILMYGGDLNKALNK